MAAVTRRRAVTILAAALAGGAAFPSYARAAAHPDKQLPLRRAHAHNDYLHTRPLLDALDHRFTSVEADIFLVDGELLVAHEPGGLDPTRTLETLYLDPLFARIKANGGSVYPGYRRPVQLLIDLKTEGRGDVSRTPPPSAALPRLPDHLRPRPGPSRRGHRRHLR